MPWVCAMRPCGPGTANSLTAPVLVEIRPIVICLFGMLQVNQRSPWKSSQASCTPQPGIITDGVPSDQSLPSFCTKFGGRPASASSGTSYSLYMTRAASPGGARLELHLHAVLAGTASLGEIGRKLLLVIIEDTGRRPAGADVTCRRR